MGKKPRGNPLLVKGHKNEHINYDKDKNANSAKGLKSIQASTSKINCIHCGSESLKRTKWQKFCSTSCRVMYFHKINLNKKEEYKKIKTNPLIGVIEKIANFIKKTLNNPTQTTKHPSGSITIATQNKTTTTPHKLPTKKRNRAIYFIKNEAKNEIKIGITINIISRFRLLQYLTTDKLNLMGIIENSTYFNEKELHLKFKHLHIISEWHKCEDDLLEYISKYSIPCYVE